MKAQTRKLQPSKNLTSRFSSQAIRLAAILLITTLLTPIIYLSGGRKVSAGSNLPVASTSAPIAAPPEAFAFSPSDTLPNTVLASIVAANQSLTEGYHSIAGLVVSPAPPEGFAMAKAPTVWENVSGLVSSFASSYVSPLLIAPSTATTAPPAPPVLLAQGTTKFDFDGDGKADPSRWQPATGEWRIKESLSNSISTLNQGISTAKIAPADYDGDGKTDRAVFESSTGTWTIKRSSDGADQIVTGFGQYGDKPVSGDYIGDNKAEVAIWRPSNGTWYVKEVNSSTITTTVFGTTGDIPVAGSYDNDGKMDYAVFRPSTGAWHTLLSGSGYSSASSSWGAGTDTPVPADYDGDGRTDFAVYRPSNGTWYAHKSSGTAGSYLSKAWGNYGDQPVPADYDQDGKDDFAVWRPTTGVWYIVKSSNPTLEEYVYETLGQAGDAAAPSAYVKQIGGQVAAHGLAKARLAPKNATGGTDLYSRNFGWGTGLVNLPGRAGLDAGFGISYNSLIWTKQSGVMVFDADGSNVSTGFRFGYPTIEPSYFDRDTGKFAYLMVTPSGKRVEFRQEAASNIYETADSSYTQLTFSVRLLGGQGQPPPVEEGTLTVTTTDGTQMTYLWKAGAFRCSQIKDRNGNFITIIHDDYGLLRSVTDTLGRVINVSYDSQHYPISITQTWKNNNGAGTDTTHTYASFTYANSPIIATNFVEPAPVSTAIPIVGPPNGTILKVLQKITYPSGGYTTFEYNGYGQVAKINNYAADQQLLNSVRTNLQNVSSDAQSNCPRFSETRTFVKDFNGSAETVVHNLLEENQTYSIGGQSSQATSVKVWMEYNSPQNVISKTWYYPAGNWREGLAFASEDCLSPACAGTDRKRWTWTAWTQDDTSLAYILNPRVEETKVGDEANTKRTEIDYQMQSGSTTVSRFGLVGEVRLYGGTPEALLKRATTDYNLNTDYTSRRIIGLPLISQSFEPGNPNPVSKVTYEYDQNNFDDSELEQNISSVIQHDNTNYGASFITGRGNLKTTTRHDVINASTVSSSVKYNTAGAPVAQIDPLGRTVKISYTDSFNDTTTPRNTYAYPTAITTAGTATSGDITSYVVYRFDIGANVKAESPGIDGVAQKGKRTDRTFDEIGRLKKEAFWKNNPQSPHIFAYTRYERGNDPTYSKVYTTITDMNGNNMGDAGDEVLAESWTDGAGRILKSRTPHKTNSYAGSLTEYDILGRVKRQSVPTEVDSNWSTAMGDDDRGLDSSGNPVFLWQSHEYDWKGRVIRIINADGTDQLTTYQGCGCAGKQVQTIKAEEIEPNKRRTKKIYSDILGREEKTEVLDWNGNVYQTTVNSYNVRDQITLIRQYAGAEFSQTYQDTTFEFDGHGRLSKQHTPQQDTNKFTTYTYFADDKPETITDARGATKHYLYNSRGLIREINWSVPPPNPPTSEIELPATVTFDYDALGNRILMNDGFGNVAYEYNSLSQLMAETRQFNETVPTAPLSNNKFKIQYTYELSGQLKSLTEPYGEVVSYGHDKIGRLKTVSGNRVNENIQLNYVTDAKYRAWGTVKRIDYGNNTYVGMNYNSRLQVQDYTLANSGSSVINYQSYQYYADGRLRFSSPAPNSNFDRSYEYDFLGRLTAAKTGAEARGLPESNPNNRPYRITLEYNQFGDVINQQRLHWAATFNSVFQYQNGRMTNEEKSDNIPGWENHSVSVDTTFDVDGRRKGFVGNSNRYKYDAEGRLIFYEDTGQMTSYDGNGNVIKTLNETSRICGYPQTYNCGAIKEKTYRVKSSVLRDVIVDVNSTLEIDTINNTSIEYGYERRLHVYAGGMEIAERKRRTNERYSSQITDKTFLKSSDSSGVDKTETQLRNDGDGNYFVLENRILDPFGAGVGDHNPYPPPPPGGHPDPNDPNCQWYDPEDQDYECGMPEGYDDPEDEDSQTGSISRNTCYGGGIGAVDCNFALMPGTQIELSSLPAAMQAQFNGQKTFAIFQQYPDGYEGFVPMNAHYTGGGLFEPNGSSVRGKLRRTDTNFSVLNRANNELYLRRMDFQTYKSLQDPKTEHTVSREELNEFESLLNQALNENARCASLIAEMLRLLGNTESLTDILKDTTSGKDTIRFKTDMAGKLAQMALAYESSPTNPGAVKYRRLYLYDTGYLLNSHEGRNQLIATLIHEMIHTGSREHIVGHVEMGEVANTAANNLGIAVPRLPLLSDYQGPLAQVYFEGDRTLHFSNLIRENCSLGPRLRRR